MNGRRHHGRRYDDDVLDANSNDQIRELLAEIPVENKTGFRE